MLKRHVYRWHAQARAADAALLVVAVQVATQALKVRIGTFERGAQDVERRLELLVRLERAGGAAGGLGAQLHLALGVVRLGLTLGAVVTHVGCLAVAAVLAVVVVDFGVSGGLGARGTVVAGRGAALVEVAAALAVPGAAAAALGGAPHAARRLHGKRPRKKHMCRGINI